MAGNGPLSGTTFNNRYQLGERIGAGGMAEVYSAQDLVLGRIVAVKTMLPQYAADADFTRRFRQEAAAAANLQSPYIVNVYDWGHDQDTYYIVMEFVRGSDLKTAIEERGAINQRKVAEIGTQVCQALTVAHQQDIIHRDVKPQNIMIQPDGNVKVMDFGIARAKNSTAQKTETVLGTAHYTSPEQAQGMDLTAASDIYSLGVVLFEAATGELPFDGPDAVSVALMQVQDQPPAPRSINPSIDPALESIILTAMQKDPAQRFATANDMRLALNDFLAGRPVNLGGKNEQDDGFSSARTSVITPIGAVAGSVDATQVIPVTTNSKTQPYGGVNGKGMRHIDGQSNVPEKKGKGPIIAVVAIIAIIALAIGAFFLFGSGDSESVPDVKGMTSEAATTAIEKAGFEVGTVGETYDDTVDTGVVVSQQPAAGSKAAKGSKISIVVSLGSEQIEVPVVTDMTEKDARAAITKAGFSVGDVKKQYSEKVEEGKVISQDPAGGTQKNKGAKINIVISEGAEQVSVPNLEGLSIDAARARAESAGFTITQGDSDYSDTIPQNCIISQKPAAGEKAAKGMAITYIVSLGKDNSVTVPNVVGSSESFAKSALTSAGLKVSVVTNYSATVPKGNVINQSIAGGGSAEEGDTITIEVSNGPDPSAGGSDVPPEE